MEDLIQDIQRRTGLPTETVVEVVTMVADYIRSAVPEDLVDQVAVYLGKAAETAGGAAGSARSTVDQAGATASAAASAAVNTAAGVAATTMDMAKDLLSDEQDPLDR